MLILLLIPLFYFLLCLTGVLILFRRFKAALIVLLSAVLVNCWGQIFPLSFKGSGEGKASDLKVLCYNIHSSSEDFSEKEIPILDMILREDPDFVYLTEYRSEFSPTLHQTLSDHYLEWYFADESGYDIIFSRYPLDEIQSLRNYLIDTDIRPYVYKTVLHKGDDDFSICFCHMDSNNRENGDVIAGLKKGYTCRAIESKAVYEFIKDEQNPLIMLGDFNDISASESLRNICKAGLRDAWWSGGLGYGKTFHDRWIRFRLDHILYDAEELKLVGVKVIGSDYSDHNPIVGKLNLRRKQQAL